MKKLLCLFLLGLIVCGKAVAGFTDDVAAANALLVSQKFSDAQKAYEKVIIDYSNVVSVAYLAQIQTRIGVTLGAQNKIPEALAAYEKVINNYPTAPVNTLASEYMWIGRLLGAQRKIPEALAAYEKVINNYPTAPVSIITGARFSIGELLNEQGKFTEAQDSFMKAATTAFISISWQNKVMQKINPALLSKEVYMAYLTKLLMIVPATTENAEFLGKVKSQLDILK